MARFLLRIWRRLRAEIVLGFLIATVFWIGILAWQTAYAPTNTEKQKCYEAAQRSGYQREECETLWERTTSDPVAFFTFWLVISTVGLGVSTVMLWRAGEKQFRLTRRVAIMQSRDMQESIAVTQRSAVAAERAAEAANRNAKAAIGVELPIVTIAKLELHRGPSMIGRINGGDIPTETNIVVDFKNRGRSAAELRSLIVQWEICQKLQPEPFYRPDSKYPFAPGLYMEPNKTLPTGQGRFYVRLSDKHLTAISEETEFFWIYGLLAFADFMGEPHEARFCAKWVRYAPQSDGALKPMGFVYDSETPAAYSRNT